eukprot:335841-Prorocentrum_minimum.AAC.2
MGMPLTTHPDPMRYPVVLLLLYFKNFWIQSRSPSPLNLVPEILSRTRIYERCTGFRRAWEGESRAGEGKSRKWAAPSQDSWVTARGVAGD